MANVRTRDEQKGTGSPRTEVGEIDTRTPFQSVKAAVSLFGEVSVYKSNHAVRKKSADNVLEKETQLVLAQSELEKIKQRIENAETARTYALSELEKAREAFNDLTMKLKAANESKQSAIEPAQAKELEEDKSENVTHSETWKEELESARLVYTSTTTELDKAREDLNKIRKDFDAALEAKNMACQMAVEAQQSEMENLEKMNELAQEISTVKEAMAQQMKPDTQHAQEEKAKIFADKTVSLEHCKATKEEAENKLLSLKEQLEPEETQYLQLKLAETIEEIEVLKEEIENLRCSEVNALRDVTSELNEATKALDKVVKEESYLRNLVASLTWEFENLKEHEGLREKVEAMKSTAADGNAGQLKVEGEVNLGQATMDKREAQLSEEQDLEYQKLLAESDEAKQEAEKMNRQAEELRLEAQAAFNETEEVERRLELVMKEVEENKAAERIVLDEMKILTERQEKYDASHSETSSIKLSADQFEVLNRKIEESLKLAEEREVDSMTRVEEITLRKNEVDKKIEDNLKETEKIKIATEKGLKNAEMAESARNMVEGELNKWRHQEQMAAEEAFSKLSELANKTSAPNSLI